MVILPMMTRLPRVTTKSAGQGGRGGWTLGGHFVTMAREMHLVLDDLYSDSFYNDSGHGEKLQVRNGSLGITVLFICTQPR